jgi:hypothetical protein
MSSALLPYSAGTVGKRYVRLADGRKVWLEELVTAIWQAAMRSNP